VRLTDCGATEWPGCEIERLWYHRVARVRGRTIVVPQSGRGVRLTVVPLIGQGVRLTDLLYHRVARVRGRTTVVPQSGWGVRLTDCDTTEWPGCEVDHLLQLMVELCLSSLCTPSLGAQGDFTFLSAKHITEVTESPVLIPAISLNLRQTVDSYITLPISIFMVWKVSAVTVSFT
jgi:hypothetical protein